MKQRRLLIDVVPTEQRSRLVPDGKVLPPQVRILLLITEKRKSNIETLVSQILAAAEPKTPGDISFGETGVRLRPTSEECNETTQRDTRTSGNTKWSGRALRSGERLGHDSYRGA